MDSSVRALDMGMAHGNTCGKRRDRIVKSLWNLRGKCWGGKVRNLW